MHAIHVTVLLLGLNKCHGSLGTKHNVLLIYCGIAADLLAYLISAVIGYHKILYMHFTGPKANRPLMWCYLTAAPKDGTVFSVPRQASKMWSALTKLN